MARAVNSTLGAKVEFIYGLIELVVAGTLLSKGKRIPVHTSWPVAALCFGLSGFVLGGFFHWLQASFSAVVAASLIAAVIALVCLAVYSARHSLGFPISRNTVLGYSLSVISGVALVLVIAVP